MCSVVINIYKNKNKKLELYISLIGNNTFIEKMNMVFMMMEHFGHEENTKSSRAKANS